MAQDPKTESIGSIVSIVLVAFDVQVVLGGAPVRVLSVRFLGLSPAGSFPTKTSRATIANMKYSPYTHIDR